MILTEKIKTNTIIYIINLDRAVERKKSVEQELLKTGIPFEFISAINANTIDTINHKLINGYKRPMVQAEIACFLSHFKVKNTFLKSKYDYAIILEDDIRLTENFDQIVQKALEQHMSFPQKQKWDVLKLSSPGRKRLFKIKEIDPNYSIYGGSVAITTMAAIWTRKGAELFIDNAVINENCIIEMPIDCALQRPWKYDLKIYNIVPHLVEAIVFESQIRPTDKLKSNFYKRLNYELNKAMPRAYFYLKTGLFR